MSYRIVWFKRDLRVQDHWPLFEAARQGPVLCLYVVEPGLWAQPDAAAQHYGFVRESLKVLDAQLRSLGARLHIAVGEVVDVLAALHAETPFDAVHAHEETGNAFPLHATWPWDAGAARTAWAGTNGRSLV
jgi:deoxyribodipyrimidine photo-lyase